MIRLRVIHVGSKTCLGHLGDLVVRTTGCQGLSRQRLNGRTKTIKKTWLYRRYSQTTPPCLMIGIFKWGRYMDFVASIFIGPGPNSRHQIEGTERKGTQVRKLG